VDQYHVVDDINTPIQSAKDLDKLRIWYRELITGFENSESDSLYVSRGRFLVNGSKLMELLQGQSNAVVQESL
jgi:hypothetical protein